MEMIDVSEKRLDEIRRTTRERANPDNDLKQKSNLKINTFASTKEKSVEEAQDELIKIDSHSETEEVHS